MTSTQNLAGAPFTTPTTTTVTSTVYTGRAVTSPGVTTTTGESIASTDGERTLPRGQTPEWENEKGKKLLTPALTVTAGPTGPTVTSTPNPNPKPTCDPTSRRGALGVGGCSNNCFCDADADGVNFYCDTAVVGQGDGTVQCTTDDDCNLTQFCSNFNLDGNFHCYTFNTCTSSFIPLLLRN